jgi:prepilin-type N-terminal cleavage/methylation domain-containing protein
MTRVERGFTLLEVLVAMMVFLVGIVGILGLFTAALGMHRDATRRARTAIASAEVQALIRAELDSIVDPNAELKPLVKVPIPGERNLFYSVTFSVDPARGVTGGVVADVHVFAMDAGRERGDSFTLYLRPRATPEALIRKAKKDRSSVAPASSGGSK